MTTEIENADTVPPSDDSLAGIGTMPHQNKTKAAIAAMLTENTGRHFLDSGGAYGRHWERNQGRDFESEPASTVSFRYGEISVTHNLYHWLAERLDLDEDANKAMRVMERWVRIATQDDYSYYELRELFPEFWAYWCWKANALDNEEDCEACEGSGRVCDPDDDDAEEFDCEECGGSGRIREELPTLRFDKKKGFYLDGNQAFPDEWEPRGIYGDGEPITDNSYNNENALSQDILYRYFTLEGTGAAYIVLQIHNGCDARGGHTRPVVFNEDSNHEIGITDYARGTIYCTGEGPFVKAPHPTLPGIVALDDDHHEHNWSCDGGSSWGDQGSWGAGVVNLEKYPTLRLVEEDVTEGGYTHPPEEGEGIGWVRGFLVYAQDDIVVKGTEIKAGTGFCPKCGGILAAGSM